MAAGSAVIGVRLLVDTGAATVGQTGGTAEPIGAVARTAVAVGTTTVPSIGTAGTVLAGLSSGAHRDTGAGAAVAREALAAITRTRQRRAIAGAEATAVSGAANG